MSEADPAGFSSIPLAVTDPERIPAGRYYDAEFFELEKERLWPHVWQMACRLETIPDVGDWIEYTNLDTSVIVVRTNEGVKAFHNACRHRGVPFAGGTALDCSHSSQHGNCSKSGFVCPFHGWRWDMNGNNTHVFGKQLFSEKQLQDEDLNLVPCRVETWAGCAFINLDDEAPGLLDTFGPITKTIDAHRAEKLRAEWWYATVLPANWKTAMEAFMEGYHVTRTHPQLHRCLPAMYDGLYEVKSGSSSPNESLSSIDFADLTTADAIAKQVEHMELISVGMAGQLHGKELDIARSIDISALPDNPAQAVPMWFGMVMQQVTEQLKARGEPVPDLIEVSQTAPMQGVEYLFPHWFLLAFFTSMASYRVRPLTPESCLFEIWSLTMYPEGEEPEPVMEPTVLPYNSRDFPPIPQQDFSNIPIQQRALHAKGFEYMRLAGDVEGLVSNYQRLIDGFIAREPIDKLGKATNQLGGNFDGKIKDLGF